MDADGIIGILVGILRVHTLCQWSEGISEALVLLHLLFLFRSQFAVALNVLQALVDIHIAGGHI